MSKKQFAPIEDFEANACTITISEDEKTCIIDVDVDGWDNPRDAYNEFESFVEGENDMIGMDIEEALAEMGLELLYPGEIDEYGTCAEFVLAKIE